MTQAALNRNYQEKYQKQLLKTQQIQATLSEKVANEVKMESQLLRSDAKV